MSYCRIGEDQSQVYAWRGERYYTYLSEGLNFTDRTRKAFYNRLVKLKAAGVKVPARALRRLRRELGEQK